MDNSAHTSHPLNANPAPSLLKQVGLNLISCAIGKAFEVGANKAGNSSCVKTKESAPAPRKRTGMNRVATVVALATLGFLSYKIGQPSNAPSI